MNTAPDHEGDLALLLRAHVADSEPPAALRAERSMALGRRTLLRRRARRGLAAAALLGAAAVTIPALLQHDVLPRGDRGGVNPATVAALEDYDATRMPAALAAAADPVVRDAIPGLAGTGVFTASDEQGVPIPRRYWDKASGMEIHYGGQGPHQLTVSLQHSRSEAEGDARKNCEGDLESGYAFSCTVSTVDGDLVTTRVVAVRRADGPADATAVWGVLTRDELRTGTVIATDPSQRPIVAEEIYFLRTTESVHSETFLTVAQETVKAPTYAAAAKAFSVPPADLAGLVTDPALVIPKPPTGENGCAWQLHPENMACNVPAP